MLKSFGWISVAAVAAIALVAVAAPPPNLSTALERQLQIAAERPGDAKVYNDLGNLLVLAGYSEEAEMAYRRAIEIDPTKVSARFNLGLLLQERGEASKALQEYRQVVEIDPRFAWAFYQMGTVYESWGQKRRAVELYARALALNPQLAFPEVNPHVIENTLLTEALLKAHSRSRETLAPQVYDEPRRIVDMLLPSLRALARGGEQVAAEQAQELAAAEQVEPELLPLEAQGRVLSEGDLDPESQVNQAAPLGSGRPPRVLRGDTISRPAPPGQPTVVGQPVDRRLLAPPPARVLVPGTVAPQTGPGEDSQGRRTAAPRPERFRPGTPSTGRLEIQLGPAAPADRAS